MSQKRRDSLSASANRWSVVECCTGLLAHTGPMLSASRRPAALRDCQHSWRDTFTLYLTSIDSLHHRGWTRLYTQEIHAPAQRRHTASDRTLHVNPPEENKPSGGTGGDVFGKKKSIKSNKEQRKALQKLVCHVCKCK